MTTILKAIRSNLEDWRFTIVCPAIALLSILTKAGSPKAEEWMWKLNDWTLKHL